MKTVLINYMQMSCLFKIIWPKKIAGISHKSIHVKNLSSGVCVAVEQETLCVCQDRMEKLKDFFSMII